VLEFQELLKLQHESAISAPIGKQNSRTYTVQMNSHLRPTGLLKGRGSAQRLAHRFSSESREAFDDGWPEEVADNMRPPQTVVTLEDAKSALSHNESPDIYFTSGLNPYRGCEHGCIYCYARPTHSYLNLSPGLDFETRIIAKRNLVPLLTRELSAPRYQPSGIAIGSATDAYQPVERELRITRGVLELLQRCQHPFGIVTKGSGVERDLDILAPMAQAGLATVVVSLCTLDGVLARKLEPRAASPLRRLRTMRTLADAGVPVGVSLAPQIPFINDDMEQVLLAAWDAGARRAFYTVVRLPWEVSPLFRQWLEHHYPDRAARVMARIAEMRGGKDYDSNFGSRMQGEGLWAELIRQRFQKSCARLGFNRERVGLDTSQFRPALLRGQVSLF
jgi:DNA repair photolyase